MALSCIVRKKRGRACTVQGSVRQANTDQVRYQLHVYKFIRATYKVKDVDGGGVEDHELAEPFHQPAGLDHCTHTPRRENGWCVCWDTKMSESKGEVA